MASILMSDIKNGIIPKEVSKKFEEATSTSGCDLEMSEITSSMPNSLPLTSIESCADLITKAHMTTIVESVKEDIQLINVINEKSSDIEDVIDGFSVFAFVTEDDLMKFSSNAEKIETEKEFENNKCKKVVKLKKENKINKATKEQPYNEDGLDIYDFHANSELSPSSKNSSLNFKKSFIKKFSTKYDMKFKDKFKLENRSPPSDSVEGRNESPRPASNEDNNVVSTTTSDNVNIEQEKLDLANSLDSIQSTSVLNPLKTASLRLYKLEDELSSTSLGVTGSVIAENSASNNSSDQQLSAYYSDSDNEKVHNNNKNQIKSNNEKYQSKIVPAKFSVDLITNITDTRSIIDEFHRLSNFDWSESKKSPDIDSKKDSHKHPILGTVVATGESNKMTSSEIATTVTNIIGGNYCSSLSLVSDTNGSCTDVRRVVTDCDNRLTNEEEINNAKCSIASPMQSWLELHNKGLIHQQKQQYSHSNGQTISNPTVLPTKSINGSSFNTLNHHSHNANKPQYDSAIPDWKNNFFDNSKLLTSSVPKFNHNLSSLNQELVNNIRYQQEQHELMTALRLKHENSKIPKPLVHMGLDSIYKSDHGSYKNPESRFQTPGVHNYIMSNSQISTDSGNTGNAFKTRSDLRCHQTPADSASNKDSFITAIPSLASSNFKGPETTKRRGQWCDMHVKIAYFIYRTQKRISMIKSQEINSQLSNMMYNQKVPPTASVPTASAYPASFLQHSSPYMDYRPSQMKPDSCYTNYQSKSSAASFLNNTTRPLNPYHSIAPQNIDVDLLSSCNSYEDQQHSPEQKWLKLLSHYLTNHPMTSVDRPNPEFLSQLYLWFQQLTNNNNNNNSNSHNNMPHFNPHTPSNLDPNSVYLRNYMDHLSSYFGSVKGDAGTYQNNSVTERDLQIYVMKQQQYQKAMLSKYHAASINKPSNLNHINPLHLNSSNSFYPKKMMEMKSGGSDPLLQSYPDSVQSLTNQKYRLTQEQIRLLKHDSLSNYHSRNGFIKVPDSNGSKRRKLNSESAKIETMTLGNEKEDSKVITDLTGDYDKTNHNNINNNNNNNNNNNVNQNKISSKSRDLFHLQTMVPDTKD